MPSIPDPGFDYAKKLGLPGQFPFTRGIYPTMYVTRPWTIRQYAGYGTAVETNRRYRYLLGQGQAGLSVAFDLPTQMGYDPGDDMARGEVGKAGVSIALPEDMQELFDGIPLDRVTVSMTINATAMILLSLLIVTAERQGIPKEKLGGTTQNDILKEFIARGCYIYPPEPSMRLATDLIEYACTNLPQWNFISVSGYHIREAGSTAAQELGFTIANGTAYAEAALKRGLDPDAFGRRVSFFFNGHNDFFEEIAKFRAARRLWAGLMRDRFGAKDPRSWTLRFHTQTAGSSLTAQQPENNVVRVALQALAAALGGTQSLHTNALDEALALPSERAASIALRTQQILANECGIQDVVDPFGGSWHLEKETDRVQSEAQACIDEVARRGGAVAAIAQKYFQREIEKSAVEFQRELEAGRRVVVGVNRYVEKDAPKVEVLRIDEKVRAGRIRRLETIRKKRDAGRARAALARLETEARGKENLMEAVLESVRASVTLGEICHALRKVFGTYDASRTA
ncbi:MAG TPA: methylmalonyl-CoA mutase family protein [Planctomycetota bacterium]|nr:methylmalonyl-CoA mutase family protein [Planctomycetota bacterium]